MHGGAGNDTSTGGVGRDFMSGGFDDDTQSGGDGSDKIFANQGRDVSDGGRATHPVGALPKDVAATATRGRRLSGATAATASRA